MSDAYVRQAVPLDGVLLAPNLRDIDKLEIAAVVSLEPDMALKLAVSTSAKSWTACNPDGQPMAIFGVAGVSESQGCIWLLCSEEFFQYSFRFLRECKSYIQEMRNLYPHLTNYVDCENAKSIRWLSWLGFEFTGFDPAYGLTKRPHIKFEG